MHLTPTTYVALVHNLSECIDRVCDRGRGDYAFLLDNSCFAVDCDAREECQPTPVKSEEGAVTAVARLKWKGRTGD